jgi:hypothetical protein
VRKVIHKGRVPDAEMQQLISAGYSREQVIGVLTASP